MQKNTGPSMLKHSPPPVGEQEPPVPPPDETALFLDLDGTLADIQPDPGLVAIPPDTLNTLQQLDRRMDGALAILSGRPGVDLDRLLYPLVLPYAAGHGAERRDRTGKMKQVPAASSLPAIHADLQTRMADLPGVWIETKGHGLAVHFRAAPDFGTHVESAVRAAAAQYPSDFDVQPGKMVFELRPHGVDKGAALRAFMQSAPFAGRRPVMVGDDLTDEAAFIAAHEGGGFGIKIGTGPSSALCRLDGPRALAAWLQRLCGPAAGQPATTTSKEHP